MGKGLGNKDFNSAVWDAGLLAQDYPTLLFQHTGHKVEDGQRGQVRETLGACDGYLSILPNKGFVLYSCHLAFPQLQNMQNPIYGKE